MGLPSRALDIAERFVAMECVVDERHTAKASVLYEHYLAWALSIGVEPLNQRYFSQAIKQKFATKRTRHGIEYLGLATQDRTELKPKPKPRRVARVGHCLRMDLSVKIPRFIKQQCEIGPHLSEQSAVLYARYKAWVVTDRIPNWEERLAVCPDFLNHENVHISTFIGMLWELTGCPVKRSRRQCPGGPARSLVMGICLRSEPDGATLAP